jgi:hypothetical protein
MYKKLLEIQKEIGAIKKDATNPFYKSKYFDINSLLEQVKPILNKHGVVLLQGLTNIDGKLALETKLISGDYNKELDANGGTFKGEPIINGDTIKYVCPLPETVDAQKAGSAITYFRRYALQSLLALEAEDDDGNGARPSLKVQAKAKLEPRGDMAKVAYDNIEDDL